MFLDISEKPMSDAFVTDPIVTNLAYHIVRLPGPIASTDAILDAEFADGYELFSINGPNAVFKNVALTGADGTDAFGKQRVSQAYSVGSYKAPYGQPAAGIFSVTSSIGINGVTPNPLRASGTLFAHGASGSWVVNQSKKYHNYIPGKSQYILESFLLGSSVSGSIKRVGYFDDFNGIFLEQDATGSLNWVIRSNATGTVEENRVPQTEWNVNTLLSGSFQLDLTKTQLLFIDFQWLGVGRVRCGFVHDGRVYLTQTFDHSNYTDKVYMAQPNLPIRSEVRNVTDASGSMEVICATVHSEGGSSDIGRTWAVSTNATLRSLASGSTLPVLAIRLKNSYNGYPNRGFVIPKEVKGFATDRSVLLRLLKLPNQSYITTGSGWVSVNEDSVVEYNVSATAFTDGRELSNGFIPASGTGNAISPSQDTEQSNALSDNFIAQNYYSTDSEIYVVVLTNLTGTATTVGASMQWGEVY